ncbi:heme ABC exporter ATP-binding protein CcmA [Sandaracinobacter sp. RS1-74]|uniref:heme ABC exporter ATP-binding protein CcmA n=1 Tax=Sandaracinobacteroides sayramensis TaxID=2913411 RepID=UPI001EDC496F|nr:heme ABC exporter ATP-binding protein CcmA [Sandaracinobacteroides sayramensis]MCG2840331.1 heme ABC exporter ATP-binding protein CcmA [Sandaracinobacteroides sayramensis]
MLRAEGIALVRGGRLLFEGLSFEMAEAGALLVTGRNGAGKSSLLRLVAGLLEPDEGAFANPFPTALLASEQALKPDRRVETELAFWAGLDGASRAAMLAAAEAMAVTPLLDFRCGQLSSGQRQRVAIARTIASGARLWLLDEPANALDAASEERLLAAIAAHRAAGGLVMAATHQPLPLPGAAELAL